MNKGLWTGYCCITLLLSVALSWHLNAQVNFLYPLWYRVLHIDQTIEKSAPNHRYKKSFDQTTQQERRRLFAQIVYAVQHAGKGLTDIKYHDVNGKQIDTLLTQSEITHLQDVSRLIEKINWFSFFLLVIALLLMALLILFRCSMPALRTLFSIVFAIIILFSVAVLIGGAKHFFYWLHTVVFPADHQWFFYYEDSLMSMLMKAPVLFAPIAVQLCILALTIWSSHLLLLKRWSVFTSA